MNPPFLQRLGLEHDADTKSIRRAYARELKLINQEHDLPGFQLLREAYETALEWAKYKQAEPADLALLPEPSRPPPAPAPLAELSVLTPGPAIPLENPHALAATVFGRFAENTKRIVDMGLLKDPSLLETEIRNRLDDDELLNITARGLFEARIAQLLFGQWTQESGVVFGAAATVFNWTQDRRRLQQFGHAGAYLDRAIEEQTMFYAQPQEQLARQNAVMARLRDPKRPTIVQIRRDLVHVEVMIKRFPNLLAMLVNRETVEQWRTLAQPSAPQEAMPEPVLAGYSNKRRFDGAWIFFVLMIAVYVAIGWTRSPKPSPYNFPSERASETSQYPSYAPGADPSAPHSPSEVLANLDSFQNTIDNDIQYRPAGSPKGKLLVVYELLEGPNGAINGVNRLQRSIEPAFDKAVEAAIMRAPPVPRHFGTLRLQFTREYGEKRRRRKAEPTLLLPEPAPPSRAD